MHTLIANKNNIKTNKIKHHGTFSDQGISQ